MGNLRTWALLCSVFLCCGASSLPDYYGINFSVTPTNCSVTPDPSTNIASVGDASQFYFTIRCGSNITEAHVDFPSVREDNNIVLTSLPSPSSRNATRISASKSQTTPSDPFVRFKDLCLCSNATLAESCRAFQINIGFQSTQTPLLTSIRVLNGPAQDSYSFNPTADVYPVTLYANVPITFAIQSDHHQRFFVDSKPAEATKGFLESSQFVNYRPRAEPGKTENITVYASDYERTTVRPYTIAITTRASGEARLGKLDVAPGRLEPSFTSGVYSYFARVPENRKSFSVSLEGLDDRNTRCIVNQDNSTTILGAGSTKVTMPAEGTPGSHTITVDCTSQDGEAKVRYTLALVPQIGGTTLLQDLDLIGGRMDRPFDPLFHGPYLANLEMQRKEEQEWVAFSAHSSNPSALMAVESQSFNNVTGMSPWFRVEKGELREFRVTVRTPQNPVEEEYIVHVDRRGAWYESASFLQKMSKWVGISSILGASDSAPAFLQNMQLMQFLSVSHRMNGKPEGIDTFSSGFHKWNLQWDLPCISHSESHTLLSNSSGMVFPPEPHSYVVNQMQAAKKEQGELIESLASNFLVQSSGKWTPTIDLTNDRNVAAALEASEDFMQHSVLQRRLSALTDSDKFKLIQDINAKYQQHRAIEDYIRSIIIVTFLLILVASIYAASVSYFVSRGVLSRDGRVRDMPKILHPIRFWSFCFDIVLIAYSQAAFGILSCPSELRNSKFLVLGVVHVTPKIMMWLAGFVLLSFPIGYICLVSWVLFSLKESIVFSKDLQRYHRKELLMAKAESRILPWLPIISNLLAVEIRDVAPIFRATKDDGEDEMTAESQLNFSEENRHGGPCNLNAPEFAESPDVITTRNNTNDQHYSMLGASEEPRIHYHQNSDEMKVSLGGLKSSYVNDADNSPLYDRYPEAEIGRKCLRVRTPYGYELDCHVGVRLKHLSNLWQMSELPHHFRFWIPRKNCQLMDFDGWNNLFEKAQRGNFFYYVIERVSLLTIMALLVCWAETSGLLTATIVAGLCLLLVGAYTPAAIATGTSKWYSHMEEGLRMRRKQALYEQAEQSRQSRWPFDDSEVKQKTDEYQRTREAMDVCGHGGWFARHPDMGVSEWSFWNYRAWFCFREFITGAPGLELTKLMVTFMIAIGNHSVRVLGNGSATVLAIIFTCLGSFCLNFVSMCGLAKQCKQLCVALYRSIHRVAIWCFDTFTDSGHLGPRLSHFFSTCLLRLTGHKYACFDFPGMTGEKVRDFRVNECILVADEVGLQFKGDLVLPDILQRQADEISNRNVERYAMTKTLHQAGPIGSHRSNLSQLFPVRLSFKDFYLGKLSTTQGVAATIHIVNHGFRANLQNQKLKNIFSYEDDSFLSLYRDPEFFPEWGVIQTAQRGHGYVVHYDHDSHSLIVKGPSLREGMEYKVRSDANYEDSSEDSSDDGSLSSNDSCVGEAVCNVTGTLYVPVQMHKQPSLYHPIEIQAPDGDRFTINPADIKVHYDPTCRELALRHRLFVETDDNLNYRVAWTVAGPGTPVDEVAMCHEAGLLQMKLTSSGIPDLRSPLLFEDSNGAVFSADPKDTDAHRVAIPRAREPRGFGLVMSRMYGKLMAVGRQISGIEALRDTVEDTIACTVVQCVNPTLGLYRLEPNFRDAMKTIRAQIHHLEAQRSQLEDVDRLAASWVSVMSGADFCRFWEKKGIKVALADGLWVNPLRDIQEPLVKSQFNQIDAAVPEFRSMVHRLFNESVKGLEGDLQQLACWVRAYDDVGLYASQLQKDLAELSGYNATTGLDNYVKKVQSLKQQYEAQLPNFIYPFVAEEKQISKMPNIAAQLRQWQKQLAVWLRAEEDAPLMAGEFGTPRSVASSNSDRGGEAASLERTVMEVMHALKANINRHEDVGKGQFRSVLHYVTDSLNVRGPYTNWRPDPIGGHLALVRIWYPKHNGTPDFERDPVWNPCCVKLSGNAIKILLPGKDDVDYQFSTPYYWSHVLGHSIQLDCLEMLQVSNEASLPIGHSSNAMLRGMPGQLVCHLTSALPHVGDHHIRLVENGTSGQEILMRREYPLDEETSSPRSSEGDAFVISLGKRTSVGEAKLLPDHEVRVTRDSAQAFPLTFRFGERYIDKWRAAIEAAQMDRPPLEIDDMFGLPSSEHSEDVPNVPDIEYEPSISESSERSLPSTSESSIVSAAPQEPISFEEWQNYRYQGKGKLSDVTGKEIYAGQFLEGRRWGKGRCTFQDSQGHWWQYEGEFVSDAIVGKGQLTLIDKKELERLSKSQDQNDHMRMTLFIGEFGPDRMNAMESATVPLALPKPALSQAMLTQLFEADADSTPVVIDVRKTISCCGDMDLQRRPLGDEESIASIESQRTHQSDKGYLSHQKRWLSALNPSLDYSRVADRVVMGVAQFADGGVYQGQFFNGVPQGKGRYMNVDGTVRYEGGWKEGVPHGFVVLSETTDDQSTNAYFGTVDKGKRSGQGVQIAKNGAVYIEGFWTNDQLLDSAETCVHVQPEAVKTPGQITRFTGSLTNGVPDGQCKFTWTDGVTYRGEMQHGKRQGPGVMRDSNKRVLISANWQNDLPHGRVSRLVQADGKVYTGDVFEGKRQGMGELYHSEKGEPLFEGLWVNDSAHGRGTLFTPDGQYEGEFKDGKRNGKGRFEFNEHPAPNGKSRVYEGDWRNDMPHGVGFYRNELGVQNTYKFSKGQLDKSSVNAYKGGMCGKAPIIGMNPTVSAAVIGATPNNNYGDQRSLDANVLNKLASDRILQPTWNRLVAEKRMHYVDPTKAPRQPLRPEVNKPSRPSSEDGAQSPDFQTESPVRQRVLKLSVLRASALPMPDGTLKPYVKAIIGKDMKKTKVGSGDSPHWNASLNFPLRRENKILFEVWDQHLESRDNFLGSGELDLIGFLDQNRRESDVSEIPIFYPDGDKQMSGGRLLVRLTIHERDVQLDSDESSMASNSAPVPPPYVYVKIHSGRSLTNMDALKNMDPYVKLVLGDVVQTSKVQKRAGVNPRFDEEFYLPYSGQSKLELEVYDKDHLKSDDLVGKAEIKMPMKKFSGSVPLRRTEKKKGTAEAGSLEITIDTVL